MIFFNPGEWQHTHSWLMNVELAAATLHATGPLAYFPFLDVICLSYRHIFYTIISEPPKTLHQFYTRVVNLICLVPGYKMEVR